MPETNTMDTIDMTPDYEIAAVQLREFYAGLGIDSRISPEGLKADADGWNHYAFEVRFSKPENASNYCRIDWRQGVGITDSPDPAEVLASAARDYADARGLTFEDWAGYTNLNSARAAFSQYAKRFGIVLKAAEDPKRAGKIRVWRTA